MKQKVSCWSIINYRVVIYHKREGKFFQEREEIKVFKFESELSELSTSKLSTTMVYLAVVGLSLLILAFFSFVNTRDFLKNALTTNGTVIELIPSTGSRKSRNTYRPRIELTTQSGSTIEFTSSFGSSSSKYSVGEVIEVLYQDSSPVRAEINDFFYLWGLSITFGGIGSVFFLVGFSNILLRISNSKKVAYLRENGVSIKASIQNVKSNTSIEVNGVNPYKIYAQWQNPTTSELHFFSSETIWFNPTTYIDTDEVTVLIERDNPKKYHVDISFLPMDIFR